MNTAEFMQLVHATRRARMAKGGPRLQFNNRMDQKFMDRLAELQDQFNVPATTVIEAGLVLLGDRIAAEEAGRSAIGPRCEPL